MSLIVLFLAMNLFKRTTFQVLSLKSNGTLEGCLFPGYPHPMEYFPSLEIWQTFLAFQKTIKSSHFNQVLGQNDDISSCLQASQGDDKGTGFFKNCCYYYYYFMVYVFIVVGLIVSELPKIVFNRGLFKSFKLKKIINLHAFTMGNLCINSRRIF